MKPLFTDPEHLYEGNLERDHSVVLAVSKIVPLGSGFTRRGELLNAMYLLLGIGLDNFDALKGMPMGEIEKRIHRAARQLGLEEEPL